MYRRLLPTIALSGIVLLGLALRLWSARGGLWLDEAWSAVLVARVRTPLDVFLAINHDNNHHLNSLWMQFCGFGASPLLLRAPSIAAGTLTILVAAAIGVRRGIAHALVAALLFAVSPILVNYGSEARGYAPMLLMATTMIWCVARDIETPAPGRPSAWILAGLALIGMFSHLTMLFFVAAIAAWVAWTWAQRMPARAALVATSRLLCPAFAACALAMATVVVAAASSPTGMQVGDYVRFSLGDWSHGIVTMATTTLGLSWGGAWIAVILVPLVVMLAWRRTHRPTPMGRLEFVAIIVFPALFPLLQIGNSGMARYYLLTAIAILLLAGDGLAAGLAERRTRIAATAVLTFLTAACLQEDIAQAALLRGDPDAAIAMMRQRAPAGATVMVDTIRPTATLRVAAASMRYPLAIVSGCPAHRFLEVDLAPGASAPVTTARCGRSYAILGFRRGARLSGFASALYEEIGPTSTAARP